MEFKKIILSEQEAAFLLKVLETESLRALRESDTPSAERAEYREELSRLAQIIER